MSKQAPSDAHHGSPVMGQVIRRVVFLFLLAVVLAGMYLFWRKENSAPVHEAASGPQSAVPVTIVTVKQETVPVQMRFLGETEASKLVEIRARVSGYLETWTFKEGHRVEKGQQLFQIDPRPFQVELAEAQARLASNEATLGLAQFQLKRIENLDKEGAASTVELEEWQAQERVATAQVQLAKAQIAAAELDLSYTSIEAPITGMIGQALKDIGSYIETGQNGLLAIIRQVDPIYFRYAVTEREILQFRRKLAAKEITIPQLDQIELEITLADGSVYPHHGRINFVDVQIDETTGTAVVRGQVPNPDGVLKPGQFIHATVLGIKRVDVIRVPQKAVSQSPSGASVMVANDQDVAEMRPVVLGEWSGRDQWIIERGLKPGDRVITDRLLTVRPGTPVVATPAAEPAAQPAAATTTTGSAGP